MADGPGRVVKLYRESAFPEVACHEFRVMRLARAAGLPVPEPLGVETRAGRPGLVMERLDGDTVMRSSRGHPIRLLLRLRRLAELQAVVHREPAPALLLQHDVLAHQVEIARVRPAARQAAEWRLARLSRTGRLCHGDFHPDNVMETSGGLCIVDWEKASSGDPAADVARTLLTIEFGRGRPRSGLTAWSGRTGRRAAAAFYVARYCRVSGLRASAIRAWRLPVLVARLAARPSELDGEITAEIDREMRRTRRRGRRERMRRLKRLA